MKENNFTEHNKWVELGILYLREERGQRLRDVYKATGLSNGTWSQLANSQTPASLKHVKLLYSTYEISKDMLTKWKKGYDEGLIMVEDGKSIYSSGKRNKTPDKNNVSDRDLQMLGLRIEHLEKMIGLLQDDNKQLRADFSSLNNTVSITFGGMMDMLKEKMKQSQ